MPRIVVVLPALNEGAVIQRLLLEIHTVLNDAGFTDHRFIVVDDGSTDNTGALVRAMAGDIPVTLLVHEQNEGLGRALRTGLVGAARDLAPDDIVLTTEADGTQPAAILPDLVRAVQDGADFVVATPFVDEEGFRGVPWHRRLLSRGANLLYSILFPIHTLHDYTNLVRAFRGTIVLRAIERYGTEGLVVRRGFESVPELILKLRPLLPRIRELPLVIDHSVLERESQMPVVRTIRASVILISIEILARAQRRLGDL